MKKTKTLRVMAVLMILLTLLAACGGGGGGDALKGTWEGSSADFDVTWKFDGKGGCDLENQYGMKQEGTYTIDGSKVKINMESWEKELDYTFTLDGDNLELLPDEEIRPWYKLTKQ